MKESIRVLQECAEVQTKKGSDYQNEHSRIRQVDYYPNGVATLLDIMHAKMLRMQSVVAAMQSDPSYEANFESIEDSAKDLINYATFVVEYTRGKMDGQKPDHDFLNRPMKIAPSPFAQNIKKRAEESILKSVAAEKYNKD
tara:strand:+ start:117 stop:539 length:423 start_codon:yes stop_codon:yes gene_type:complete